jgi:hypothetical protein
MLNTAFSRPEAFLDGLFLPRDILTQRLALLYLWVTKIISTTRFVCLDEHFHRFTASWLLNHPLADNLRQTAAVITIPHNDSLWLDLGYL